MKIIIAGDFCDYSDVTKYVAAEKYEALFKNVCPVISGADLSLVNFEFPIVEDACVPIAKYGPNLRGQRKSVNAIKYAGFTACTLANNHILDQGEDCCLNTKKLLEDGGLMTVGVGKNLNEAGKILYYTSNGKTIAIINCCETEFSVATESRAGANPLNPVSQWYKIQEAKTKADYVMVVVHGGVEHYQLPTPRMKETYRYFIDAGADAVVNHHQHCYSGYEFYHDKPIVYGLGNFCFADFANFAKKGDTWFEGYLAELSFGDAITLTLHPYVQCRKEIGVRFMDGNEELAFRKELERLNAIIASDDELRRANIERLEASFEDYKRTMQPYSARIAKALYNRHLLPSVLSKKFCLRLKNNIECESHNEGLIYAINKIINN